MARILARKGKKKTTYTATVRARGYESVSRTFDTKGEARAWAAELEAEIKSHRFKDPRRAHRTLEETLDRYLETVTPQKSKTTQERERRIIKILKQHLGKDTFLPDVTPSVVAKYRDQRLKTVSAYAVRLELALLSHLFAKACKEWELPVDNPVKSIERPKVPKGRIIFLKEDEAVRLLKECRVSRNKMLYPYVLVLLHTAMRPSEAAGLTMGSDFVFLKNEGKSEHSINIPSSRFRSSFDKARDRAGLPSVHMHDLRHTAASHMLMAGTDIRTLAAILGHSTLQMVLRYTHLIDEHKLKAVDRINTLGLE